MTDKWFPFQVTEHSETSILGPGFLTSLASVMPPVELRPGQLVYVTHGGREVMGSVRSHQLIQVSSSITSHHTLGTQNGTSLKSFLVSSHSKLKFALTLNMHEQTSNSFFVHAYINQDQNLH